jgi:serine O-acetyltransferase
MIQSKRDLIFYKEADRIISGRAKKSIAGRIKGIIAPDHIQNFLILLRTVEYYRNCRKGIIGKLFETYFFYRFNRISVKLGFSIPPNVFGPGLFIPHYGTIVINSNAKVGANCVLHTCVCIAGNDEKIIGDNVYFSTGSVVSGKTRLSDNVTISVNSLVNKSFEIDNILLGGTPAKVLKERKPWYIEDGPTYINRVNEINKLKHNIYNQDFGQ